MSLPGRRPTTFLTLTAVAAASGVLALPAQTAAHAGAPACSSVSAHRKHDERACSRSHQRTATHRKAKAHVKHPAKSVGKGAKRRRHATKHLKRRVKKHATKKVARKTTRKAKRKAPAVLQVKATCEDGSTPARTGTDAFSCDDSSEPSCENGSFPIVAASGKTLICNDPAKTGSGPATTATSEAEEAVCEDGSAPMHTGPDTFRCDDGSEPFCEEGNYPTVSSDGATLQCVAEEEEQ